jgi:hypothetical protein
MGKIRGTTSGKGKDFKKILAFSLHRGWLHPGPMGYFCVDIFASTVKSSVE